MILLIYCKIGYLYLPRFCLVYDQIHLKIFGNISNCNAFFSLSKEHDPCMVTKNVYTA